MLLKVGRSCVWLIGTAMYNITPPYPLYTLVILFWWDQQGVLDRKGLGSMRHLIPKLHVYLKLHYLLIVSVVLDGVTTRDMWDRNTRQVVLMAGQQEQQYVQQYKAMYSMLTVAFPLCTRTQHASEENSEPWTAPNTNCQMKWKLLGILPWIVWDQQPLQKRLESFPCDYHLIFWFTTLGWLYVRTRA